MHCDLSLSLSIYLPLSLIHIICSIQQLFSTCTYIHIYTCVCTFHGTCACCGLFTSMISSRNSNDTTFFSFSFAVAALFWYWLCCAVLGGWWLYVLIDQPDDRCGLFLSQDDNLVTWVSQVAGPEQRDRFIPSELPNFLLHSYTYYFIINLCSWSLTRRWMNVCMSLILTPLKGLCIK